MRVAVLGLLLLAACGTGEPALPADQDTADHRACQAEAARAPGLAALDAQRNPSFQANTDRLEEEARGIRNRAYRDCLRMRGVAMPGGVQAVQRR